MPHCYFPLLKTTDAELKGYRYLDATIRDGILPIFELTKSRISKKNKHGSIQKRLDVLNEAVGKRKFILDLTTEEQLSNREIKKMLTNTAGGFQEWIDFIGKIGNRNIIPMIHYDPRQEKDVKKQIVELNKMSRYLAFRVPIGDDDLSSYITQIKSVLNDTGKLIIVLDGNFVNPANIEEAIELFITRINEIKERIKPKAIITVCSGFPSSVVVYGEEGKGQFDMIEQKCFERVRQKVETKELFYGDFGSVHPIRYITGGGKWIPRIDVPLSDKFFYYRFRREHGGYVDAAECVVEDARYRKIKEFNVWGDQEICSASKGEPNGQNPAHWIAVRINLYITRQYLRLKKKQNLSL